KLQSELDDTRRGGRSDNTVIRGSNRGARIAKINVVEEIEKLRADMKIDFLAKADYPEYGKVGVGGARTAQNVLATIAKRALPRLDERRSIKPHHAALREAAARVANLLSSFVA